MNSPGLTALLHEFCARTIINGADYTKPLAVWNYRGDLTQSGENRLKATMSPEEYEHKDWDTLATDGRIIVLVARAKLVSSEKTSLRMPGDIYRTLIDVHERRSHLWEKEAPMPQEDVGVDEYMVLGRRVARCYVDRIRLLPSARFCGMTLVSSDPLYFRFDGGAGCVMPLAPFKKEAV